MSQYVAPARDLTDRDVLLLVHQQLFILTDRLYGNGDPGEIHLLHERISSLKKEQTEELKGMKERQSVVESWQQNRSGGSDLLRVWVPILIAAAALIVAWIRH